MRCLGEQWAPARVSQTPFGARVVFRKLVLSWLFFRKLLNRSFCCSSQGCCIIPLSAFLWGVIIAVSMRSGVTSPRVTERMGGRGRKSRGKPYPQWEPRRQFGSPLRCEQKQRVSGLKSCVCQVKTVGGRYSNQGVGVSPSLSCNKQK